MYGMIHRGIRDMVIEHSGADAWTAIENRREIGPEHLISAKTYDDALTIELLGIAAETMGQTVPECLRWFGRHWVRFAERGSFGAMMNFTGKDIATFIGNLDRLHQAVRAAMPDAQVPSFTIAERAPGLIRVEYRSDRDGLEPFVVGLLEGLLDRFGHEGMVESLAARGNAAEFAIRFAED